MNLAANGRQFSFKLNIFVDITKESWRRLKNIEKVIEEQF